MLEVDGLGTIKVDTAYGGDSFVIVDAAACGFALVPDEARDLAELGMRITRAADAQLGFSHPENPECTHFSFCQFAGPLEQKNGVNHTCNGIHGDCCIVIPGLCR